MIDACIDSKMHMPTNGTNHESIPSGANDSINYNFLSLEWQSWHKWHSPAYWHADILAFVYVSMPASVSCDNGLGFEYNSSWSELKLVNYRYLKRGMQFVFMLK